MNDSVNSSVIEDLDFGERAGGRGRNGHEVGKRLRKLSWALLSDRQLEFLKLCFDQYFLKNSHVQTWLKSRFNFKNSSSCRVSANQMIGKLSDNGFIEISKPKFQNYIYYNVTSRGIKLLIDHGLVPENGHYCKLDDTNIVHDSIVTDVRIMWEQIADFQDWQSSRELKLIQNQPDDKIPDLEACFFNKERENVLHIAMEIEMTRKTNARYSKIFENLERSHFDIIFYFVWQKKLKEVVLELSKNYDIEIYCVLIDEFLESGGDSVMISNDSSFRIGQRFKHSS